MWPFSSNPLLAQLSLILSGSSLCISIKSVSSEFQDESVALAQVYMFYIDRVLGNISGDDALLAINKLIGITGKSMDKLSVLKTDKNWNVVQEKILSENKWKFSEDEDEINKEINNTQEFKKSLGVDFGNRVLRTTAELYAGGNGLYCNTCFSNTVDIEHYACESLEAMFYYLTKRLDYVYYGHFLLPALMAQLKVYNGRKPSLGDLGKAPRYGVEFAMKLKEKLIKESSQESS